MHVLLESARLRLRRFTAVDIDHLFALDNDPAVMRYINGGIPTPRTVIEQDILPRFCHINPQQPVLGFWAADERSSGAFIGWFSLRPTADDPHVAVLGYRLAQAAWGRGLATEGAAALVAAGFTQTGLTRIVATTYEKNVASQRVMAKVGMKLVRTFRFTPAELGQSDTHHDDSPELWEGYDVEYALDKANWERERRG